MQYVDALCHEYGWSAHHVFFEVPFPLAQRLGTTISERHNPSGGGHGYVDREVTKARAEMKAYLREHYEIV